MKTMFGVLFAIALVAGLDGRISWSQDEIEARWWRGNLHTHSLWSDGNDFPEMITKWYADHDYNFLAMTDHNILSQGEFWRDYSLLKQRGAQEAIEKCRNAFGEDWIETRKKPDSENDERQVRLHTLSEYRDKFEVDGEFLLIEAEEISDRSEGGPVHMNATNLRSVISPVGGATVQEAINNNLRAVAEQAKKNGEPVLVHLNHPNFGWAVTAEDLAAVTNERFFEVYNGHPSVNHLGSETRAGVEKIWDIANTIRIGELNAHPMFGLATDDSHYYHGGPGGARTGRGWVMVRSKELSAVSLIDAMNQGEFYGSSGVTLDSVEFDRTAKRLTLQIEPQPGETFSTQFIGTRKGYDRESVAQLDANGKPIRATRVYSKDVGEILATSESLKPSYQLTGDELYVRAVVTSSRKHPDPSFRGQAEQAWTQPIGWRPHSPGKDVDH